MTLVEVTYELLSPLRAEQLRALSIFAAANALRRFRIDEERNLLSFEYEDSRLRESQILDALRMARIRVQRRV
jgi:hypothetical protein